MGNCARILLFSLLLTVAFIATGQEGMRITTGDSAQVSKLIKQSIFLKKSNVDSAMSLLKDALKMSRQIGYKEGIGRSLLGVSLCLMDKKEYVQSKKILCEAGPYCIKPDKYKMLSTQYYNGLAVIHTIQGNNDSAIHYYYRSLEEMNKKNIKSPAMFLILYANLGGLLSIMEQPDQSLYYSRKALPLAVQLKDSIMRAQIYQNIGAAFQTVNIDSSLYYWNIVLPLYKKQGQSRNLQNTYYGMGRVLLFRDSLEKAMTYFENAVAADKTSAESNSSLQQGIGGVYFKKGKYGKSIAYYLKALSICQQQGLRSEKLTIYYTLAMNYDKLHKSQLAYEYQKRYADLRDSLLNENNIKTVNQLEVKYRTSEKDKELVQKKLQLTQQQSNLQKKNTWIAGISAGTLLLIVLLVVSYRANMHKQRLQTKQIENLNQEQEIMQLKAQRQGEEEERVRLARELHDGIVVQFSAVKMNLSVLPEQHPGLNGAKDFTRIIKHLDDATHALRKTAHNLMPDVLLESGLSEAIYYFCKDLQQSSGIHIDYQQYVDLPRFLPEWELSLYRIVQELLQNVMKHAAATQILIQLSYAEGILNITVEDNGKGFDVANKPGEGIGLKNIRARICALKGHIDIESRPGNGTTVYIEIAGDKLIS
ncbi:MAG: sensor histidine kinase [Taibaiella sp.]|jgi:signal transduction histidine kinase